MAFSSMTSTPVQSSSITPPIISSSISSSVQGSTRSISVGSQSQRSVPLSQKQSKLAIDWGQLCQLSDGNQDFEMELIKLFFVETKTLLGQLSTAIACQDCPRVEHLAHQLKGSSGNMGFRKMSAIAGQLEGQSKQKNLTNAPILLQALTEWIFEIQHFLE